MNDRICIFAGTTEGRRLAEILSGAADLTVCVATEYGGIMLDGISGIDVRTGRMDRDMMTELFEKERFDLVIDATHPYAVEVTANILAAAETTGTPLMRILRETEEHAGRAVYVSSVKEAKEYLLQREGNILLTTGSKELSEYSGLDMSRVWARVLPSHSSLEACENAGIAVPHIIAAQGPFSYDINLAQLKAIGAAYLVTKASGKNGGFEDKVRAAYDAGAVPVIIGEPPQTEGLSFEEAVAELEKKYVLRKRKIYIIGIGPGDCGMLTAEARNALGDCDAVIGASSVVRALNTGKPAFAEFMPDKVRSVLENNPSIRKAAVVMRGDTGFFSGTKNMLEALGDEDVTVIPGISSVSAFAARTGINWDGAALITMHGRDSNLIYRVCTEKKTFVLAGGDNSPQAICRRLCGYGLGGLTVMIGEKLSYPDEKISRGTAAELAEREFDSLSVVYIENPCAEKRLRAGTDDSEFIRGDVPMTKSEVRAVSLSKLGLSSDSVVWDIGAGTGSVSVECALAAFEGTVYAVEKEADAAELIRQNMIKFGTENISVVEGTAPGALGSLPAPTHVFIGGSSGNIREIINVILKKNPTARIVANTVTLESQNDIAACASVFGFSCFECVTVNISRSQKVGRYNMMRAQNPVSVFTMQGGAPVD